MLKRPSARRKSPNKVIALNLVPMLDALVTLIAFLMFSIAFLAFVNVESPLPIASSETMAKSLREKPLQLTLTIARDHAELWSPFDLIQSKRIPHVGAKPDLNGIHDHVVNIKQKFPTERQIVFVPDDSISYDTLVSMMDTVRLFQETDPPVFVKNRQTGVQQQVKRLFPEIVFGNLLGEK